jgi:hypothetical protein
VWQVISAPSVALRHTSVHLPALGNRLSQNEREGLDNVSINKTMYTPANSDCIKWYGHQAVGMVRHYE